MSLFEIDNYIPISFIKQYVYCPHRFSLIAVENLWGNNFKIIEGNIVHEKVNNPFLKEKRKDIIISRSVPVYSKTYNLYGIVDLIEFHKDINGVSLPKRKDKWIIFPIEYKNGKEENSQSDSFQLCAEVLCLEEIFNTKITSGAIYYNATKKRKNIEFTDELKNKTLSIITEMKYIINNNIIVAKKEDQNCSLCSLYEQCIPSILNNSQEEYKKRLGKILK